MSKVEVNEIAQQTGTTLTVGGGACKTVKVCGTTVTIGRCGGTVTLASGATQSGFGSAGQLVDWCTTAKTSPLTAVSGKGYFINTCGGAITVTLPSSPSAGDFLALKDYATTWATNNVTLARNGSKINAGCNDAYLTGAGQSVTLLYVDGTRGWQDIQDSTSSVTGNEYIVATGGTITTSGNDKIHTFTGSGTFTVSAAAVSAANNEVSYIVVGGGGGGGGAHGGGGGAGGFREDESPITPYTSSPLDGAGPISVAAQAYPISVGAGGTGGSPGGPYGTAGGNSIFSSITSTGGGNGSTESQTNSTNSGGSGGG